VGGVGNDTHAYGKTAQENGGTFDFFGGCCRSFNLDFLFGTAAGVFGSFAGGAVWVGAMHVLRDNSNTIRRFIVY
jgi:hypothetical protein